MKPTITLTIMLFLHCVADYLLQGILAKMKQRDWWIDECNKAGVPYNKYENDYMAALLAHSFEWAFIVMLPMLNLVIKHDYSRDYAMVYFALLFVNIWCHCVVDHLKANLGKLNLIQDQVLHIAQIFVTMVVWWLFTGMQ